MNVFVRELSRASLDSSPDRSPTKFVVEDNVGEGIHVHYRNVRFEMSIDDYRTFANELAAATEEIDRGSR